MSDIAKKGKKLTPLDKRNHGEGKGRPLVRRAKVVTTSTNPTMKRSRYVAGGWQCLECGGTYRVDKCGFCDGKRNRMKV